ncbi:hypothetical protein Gotur_012999 [Gossypium turneri]
MYVSEFFEFQEGCFFFFMDLIDGLGKVWTVLENIHTHERLEIMFRLTSLNFRMRKD